MSICHLSFRPLHPTHSNRVNTADHQAPRVRTSFCIEDALRTFASHKPSDEVFLAVLEQMKDPYAGLRGRDQIDRCGQTLFWDLQKRYLEAKPQPPANSMMDMLEAPGPMFLATLRTAAPPSKVEMYTEWLEASEFVLEAVEVSAYRFTLVV